MSSDNREAPLRITEEDAADKHVDDLLKRQVSLQGEKGITADRSRKWYYSNWFVFALTGAFFATLAWLMLEPTYSDTLHVKAKNISVQPIDANVEPSLGIKASAMVTLEFNDNPHPPAGEGEKSSVCLCGMLF